jgi:NAD-dependent dihydropyrimidine dehydrogenase PreA subunit
MSVQSRAKDKERAAYLKAIGAKRSTGRCPMGCGAAITNGGQHLLIHLNTCHGPSHR